MRRTGNEVWCVSGIGRVGATALVVFWLALVIGLSVGGRPSAGVVVLLWIAFLAIVTGVWFWDFVPYVFLNSEAVVVQNRVTKADLSVLVDR